MDTAGVSFSRSPRKVGAGSVFIEKEKGWVSEDRAEGCTGVGSLEEGRGGLSGAKFPPSCGM